MTSETLIEELTVIYGSPPRSLDRVAPMGTICISLGICLLAIWVSTFNSQVLTNSIAKVCVPTHQATTTFSHEIDEEPTHDLDGRRIPYESSLVYGHVKPNTSYHWRIDCEVMKAPSRRKHFTAMTRKDAQGRGLSACSFCFERGMKSTLLFKSNE